MAGELNNEDYQVEYNGFVFGNLNNGGVSELATIDILTGTNVRTSDVEILLADGVFPGRDFLGPRVFTMSIEIWGGTVDISHFMIWNVGDDSFDLDQGWRGRAQHGLIVQGASNASDSQGSGASDNVNGDWPR